MRADFLEFLKQRGYSANTLDISRRWLEHFEARYPVTVDKLRPRDLTTYRQSLCWEPGPRGKLYTEHSVNQAVGVLKSYFRWCGEQGALKKNPAEHLVTRRPPAKEQTTLTPSQARALLESPDLQEPLGLRDRAILGLVLEHRASPCALSRLQLADFQPDTGALLLRGRRRRIVTLSPGLQTDLERYLRLGRAGTAQPGEQALFVSKGGKRMISQTFREVLIRHSLQADVPKPSFSS